MNFEAFLFGPEDSPPRPHRSFLDSLPSVHTQRRRRTTRDITAPRQPPEDLSAGNNNLKPEETTTTKMATAQHNSFNNDDDNDTNDCPICLCPLSTPWGICTPCGHAYCRGCWDQLTASHCSGQQQQRNRGNNKPSCAVCKTVCKEFVTVFVDLNVASSSAAGTGGGGAVANASADGAHDMSQLEDHDENDDKLDQLTNEWDKLWKELETLHPDMIISKSNDDDDDDSEVDNNDNNTSSAWDNGQREVAAICANFIDLTQTNIDDDDDDSASQVPITSRNRLRTQQEEKTPASPLELEARQQKEQQSHTILRRIKQLHCEIMQLQLEITKQSSSSSYSTSSTTTITTQQTQKLRSKVIKLQSTNADLTSQLQSHQSEVDTLTTKMESYQKSLTERTVETEREKRKADKLASEFNLMEQSYQKHMSKSSMEQTALKSDIRRLQDQITKLSSQSGLQDLQEMEEIRRKYTKMSQDVHSLRSENTRLTKRLEDERVVWRRDLVGREKVKGKQMMSEMVTMQSSSEVAAVAGGSIGSGGLARSTGSQNKSIKSRKVSLDGRGRDQQASTTSRQKMTSVSTSASTTTSPFDMAAFPPPRSKSKVYNKGKALDILDKTRSRKHSLQNSLLMSVKRTKSTSFAKTKAPRKSNVSAAEVVTPRPGVHSFFRRNEER
eukprot:scaffold11953_cov72-Skeletonema_marinoi.AAC.1